MFALILKGLFYQNANSEHAQIGYFRAPTCVLYLDIGSVSLPLNVNIVNVKPRC